MVRKVFVLMGIVLALATGSALAGEAKFLQLSVFDPIQMVPANESIQGVRLSVFYTLNKDMTGLSYSIFGVNRTTGDVQGVELGLGDWTDGSFYGWQPGLVSRTGKRFVGWQGGVVAITEGDFTGLQSGLVAYTQGFFHGWQAGWVNYDAGRFVGLLVSADKHVLPALDRGWHAVDCTDTEGIDRVVQAVLDAPVGVFGIDVRSLPMTHGERWLDGVALLIDWTLRLMPVDAQCTLQVKVEQRGVFSAGQSWDVVRRECLRRLALAYPHRASRIDLQIEVVLKTGTPLNGYVDAIAFTWAGSTDSSKARLKFSGWEGTCLLNSSAGTDARTMLYAWDAFAQGVNLPPGLWWDMVCSSDARNPAAFMPALLNLVGNETITLPSVWAVFLAEVKARMAATPVDLQGLAAAVDWLQRYQPADATILPAMRLIWLTVQLAHANHTGRTEQQWQAELERLGDQLLDESAPLVCHADLHRAVAATNRYDIQGARSPNAGMKMG